MTLLPMTPIYLPLGNYPSVTTLVSEQAAVARRAGCARAPCGSRRSTRGRRWRVSATGGTTSSTRRRVRARSCSTAGCSSGGATTEKDAGLAVETAYSGEQLVGALPLVTFARGGLRVATFIGARRVLPRRCPAGRGRGPGARRGARRPRECGRPRLRRPLRPGRRLAPGGAGRAGTIRLFQRIAAPLDKVARGVAGDLPGEDRFSKALAPQAAPTSARGARQGRDRPRPDDRRARARARGGLSRPRAALERAAGRLRSRDRDRETLQPRRTSRPGGARRGPDRLAAPRRQDDRVVVVLRARGAWLPAPARVRPGLRALLAGPGQCARHPGVRGGRGRDTRGVPGRRRAVQDRAGRSLRAPPPRAGPLRQHRGTGGRPEPGDLAWPARARQALGPCAGGSTTARRVLAAGLRDVATCSGRTASGARATSVPSGAWTRRGAIPGVGPTLPAPAKAAATRARSAWWFARSRGRPDGAGLGRTLFYHRVSG